MEKPQEYLNLWRWVVRFAQEEAAGAGDALPWQRSWAIRWLTTGTRSYYTVCSLAGFTQNEATYLKEQAQRKWKR